MKKFTETDVLKSIHLTERIKNYGYELFGLNGWAVFTHQINLKTLAEKAIKFDLVEIETGKIIDEKIFSLSEILEYINDDE